ncbi:MAG TPA: hypothetical protein VGH99_07845 [Pseudonocardia sp.]|jgi:hypothetical protein
MRALQIVTRGVAPLAVAAAAVGLMSTAAWASPAQHRPPTSVTAGQCRAGHGHVDRDRFHPHQFHCQGGRFSGRSIRF